MTHELRNTGSDGRHEANRHLEQTWRRYGTEALKRDMDTRWTGRGTDRQREIRFWTGEGKGGNITDGERERGNR